MADRALLADLRTTPSLVRVEFASHPTGRTYRGYEIERGWIVWRAAGVSALTFKGLQRRIDEMRTAQKFF